MESLKFSPYKIMSPVNRHDFISSFPIWMQCPNSFNSLTLSFLSFLFLLKNCSFPLLTLVFHCFYSNKQCFHVPIFMILKFSSVPLTLALFQPCIFHCLLDFSSLMYIRNHKFSMMKKKYADYSNPKLTTGHCALSLEMW